MTTQPEIPNEVQLPWRERLKTMREALGIPRNHMGFVQSATIFQYEEVDLGTLTLERAFQWATALGMSMQEFFAYMFGDDEPYEEINDQAQDVKALIRDFRRVENKEYRRLLLSFAEAARIGRPSRQGLSEREAVALCELLGGVRNNGPTSSTGRPSPFDPARRFRSIKEPAKIKAERKPKAPPILRKKVATHIYQRGEEFSVIVDTKNHRRHSKQAGRRYLSKTGFATLDEARAWRDAARAEVGMPVLIDDRPERRRYQTIEPCIQRIITQTGLEKYAVCIRSGPNGSGAARARYGLLSIEEARALRDRWREEMGFKPILQD